VVKIDIDGTVLSGNQRKKALEELNIKEVFVMVPNRKLSQEEMEQVAIESNMNDGDWDFSQIVNFDEKTLLDLGWASEDLDKIFNKAVEDDDYDVETEAKKIIESKVKFGDLYEVNGHRILCGDSRNPKHIEKLMDGKNAKLIFSSPPYNLAGGMYKGNYKDNLGSEEYVKFNLDVINNCKKPLKGFCFWNISYNSNARSEFIEIIYKIIKETGLQFLELIVWDKGHALPIVSKQGLTRRYEDVLLVGDNESIQNDLEIFFCGVNDKKVYFNKKNQRGVSNYWRINTNQAQQKNHLACFPVALPIKGIELMTQRGDIILDPFLGSGTTLIASERTGRKCFGIDLSPVYIELVLNRFKLLFGKEATLVGNINDLQKGSQSNQNEPQQANLG